jgi:uncharacterized protein YecE (DUF72 family)
MVTVGTCSWTEKTLIQSGEFYPRSVKTAEGRLRYYADHFNTVEVDSPYYALPDKRNTSLWVERTPENFIFHIKVYGALTGHGIDPKTLPPDIRSAIPPSEREKRYVYIKEAALLKDIAERFRDALVPLSDSRKLGVLVFQYPPWFHYRLSSLDYIVNCASLMEGLPIGVEFRHGSWLTADKQNTVFKFLQEHQITYIGADEPQYGNLATVPFIPRVTTDIAYYRFHGRNKENWLKKGIATTLRYAYLYGDDELKKFVPALRESDKRSKVTYAMFNNCHGGFAIKNALRIREILKEDSRGQGS